MADGKKKLKEKHARPGYKTVVKTTKPGQAARMEKRGFTKVTSVASGQSKSKPGTKAKKTVGGTIANPLKRHTVYQKRKKDGGASSYRNVRSL